MDDDLHAVCVSHDSFWPFALKNGHGVARRLRWSAPCNQPDSLLFFSSALAICELASCDDLELKYASLSFSPALFKSKNRLVWHKQLDTFHYIKMMGRFLISLLQLQKEPEVKLQLKRGINIFNPSRIFAILGTGIRWTKTPS